ncbi:hypothetical protein ES705_15393 [subsurface metagenome]
MRGDKVPSKTQLEKPRKNEQRIGEEDLIKIIESDNYYTKDQARTKTGTPFFYFHEYDDYLKGQLLSKQHHDDIKRQASYRIRVEAMRHDGAEVPVVAGQVAEFPGNRQLQRVIDKNELIGSTIKIVYIGREKTRLGHSAKIYDVFKITGISKESESRQDGSKRKYKKRIRSKAPMSGAARIRQAAGRTR